MEFERITRTTTTISSQMAMMSNSFQKAIPLLYLIIVWINVTKEKYFLTHLLVNSIIFQLLPYSIAR
jgi:hypothetical protein